jgi:hypothetical protein
MVFTTECLIAEAPKKEDKCGSGCGGGCGCGCDGGGHGDDGDY